MTIGVYVIIGDTGMTIGVQQDGWGYKCFLRTVVRTFPLWVCVVHTNKDPL